jgi:hypothetical protein
VRGAGTAPGSVDSESSELGAVPILSAVLVTSHVWALIAHPVARTTYVRTAMTQSYPPPDYAQADLIDTPIYSEASYSGGDSDQGTTEVARDQASQVGQSAAEAGQHVTEVAKDQAGSVASEAGRQAKDLLRQAQSELADQAGAQQQKVASGLRSMGDELHSMSAHDGDQGVATDLAKQAAGKAHDLAGWLDNREPGQLLSEVRNFARERPGAFLAIALGAGLVSARLARGVAGANSDDESSSPSTTKSPTMTAQSSSTGLESSLPVGGYDTAVSETQGFGAIGLDGSQDYPSDGLR